MASKIALAPVRQCLRQSHIYRPTSSFQIWRGVSQRGRMFSVAAALREKKYSQDHEWVELSSDNKTVTLGITTYAAQALGDVVFVELPEKGAEVAPGDSVGAVESVKSASDIMTPVSGTVVERNEALEEKPKLLNEDPEGDGWIAKIEVTEGDTVKSEMQELMDEAGYKSFTEESK